MSHTVAHLDPDTLSAYVDGELNAAKQEEIRAHLTECHTCTALVFSGTQLKAATAAAGQRYHPSPDALARLRGQLRPQPQKTARLYTMGSIQWAAIAALLLLAVSLLGWRELHRVDRMSAELLDQHLATLSSAAAPQVISTDRHTVKPWFQGRLPFSFNLPDAVALPPDTTLRGADLTYLDGQAAALLLFTIHKHQVSVFLTQRTRSVAPDLLEGNRSGFTIKTANTPELHFIAVSDVNPADLGALVAALVRAQ